MLDRLSGHLRAYFKGRLARSTGWQPHTVRAFLAAVVRKKLGLRLESEKTDGERVYRIVAGKASADATSVPSA